MDEDAMYISSPRREDVTLVNHLIDMHNMECQLDVIDDIFNDRDKK